MVPQNAYLERRNGLAGQLKTGLVLLLGNDESAMNYVENCYSFRQDSTFLYYFGLDSPGLAALLDIDEGTEAVFGNDPTMDGIVWTGPQPSLRERCEAVGVRMAGSLADLAERAGKALRRGQPVHFLPPYRAEHTLALMRLLGIDAPTARGRASVALIEAIVSQRSRKTPEEIAEIEAAIDITYEMQTLAMKMTRPAMVEQEVAGAMEGAALSRGVQLAFPTIFSIRGETLHNHSHDNVMKDGDLAVNDCGAESRLHYASDITRTIPVSGKFTERQKEVYSIIFEAQRCAIGAVMPNTEFRQVHRLACRRLVAGLKDLGLMTGDPDEAVEAGAHTLFFPCGVGHMMGLDVHDMEALGEDYVGYTETIRRNPAFGWKSLRLARALEPGFVVTIEPGIYFIPELIARWRSEGKHKAFVNYAAVEKYIGFGGIRIEDDLLVTEEGHRVLGRPIPKAITDIESLMSDSREP